MFFPLCFVVIGEWNQQYEQFRLQELVIWRFTDFGPIKTLFSLIPLNLRVSLDMPSLLLAETLIQPIP